MAGFLYFLPGERVFSAHLLAEYGLTHIVDAIGHAHSQQVVRGPENLPGMLVGSRASWDDSDVRWSDRLKWRDFPKPHAPKQAKCCWIDGDAMPGPTALARDKQLPGEWLTLADGNQWLVPNARRWDDGSYNIVLPRTIDVNDDGGFVHGDVLPAYRKIWDHANRYWDAVTQTAKKAMEGDNAAQFTFDNPIHLVVDALAANYRVSAREVGIMQIVDDKMWEQFASVLIDAKGMETLEKKTDNDTGSG